ncbi:MAG: transposase, partial [Candidatus Aminicenantales bacterium]
MARDHVHMVMIIPPGYALRDVVGKVKGRTASRLRKKISWLERVYWRENVVWAPGYFVHSFQDLVSLNEQNKRNSWQPEKKSHNADALPIFLKFQGSK